MSVKFLKIIKDEIMGRLAGPIAYLIITQTVTYPPHWRVDPGQGEIR